MTETEQRPKKKRDLSASVSVTPAEIKDMKEEYRAEKICDLIGHWTVKKPFRGAFCNPDGNIRTIEKGLQVRVMPSSLDSYYIYDTDNKIIATLSDNEILSHLVRGGLFDDE